VYVHAFIYLLRIQIFYITWIRGIQLQNRSSDLKFIILLRSQYPPSPSFAIPFSKYCRRAKCQGPVVNGALVGTEFAWVETGSSMFRTRVAVASDVPIKLYECRRSSWKDITEKLWMGKET
jgi:hypothetical protein